MIQLFCRTYTWPDVFVELSLTDPTFDFQVSDLQSGLWL